MKLDPVNPLFCTVTGDPNAFPLFANIRIVRLPVPPSSERKKCVSVSGVLFVPLRFSAKNSPKGPLKIVVLVSKLAPLY